MTVTLNLRQTYDASPEDVWAVVGDFYAVHTWLPAVTATRRHDATRSRVAVLPDGSEVVEQLLGQGVRWQRYRVVGGAMPVAGFTAELRVEGVPGGTSEVVWQARFEPAGVPADKAEAVVRGVFEAGLASIGDRVGS